jgi:uncharacterized protein involved in outer membrane biogenesis
VSRFTRWLIAAAAAIVLLVVAAVVALPYLVDVPRVQSLIASSASQALGRPVRFQAVSVSVLPLPAVDLRGLEIAEDPRFGTTPFVELDHAELRLRLGPLLRGRIEFGDLVLKKPTVTLIQDAAGRWNFASLGAPQPEPRPGPPRPPGGAGPGGGAAVLASRVRLDDGVVTYLARGPDGPASRYRLEAVDLTLAPRPGSFAVEGSARLMPGGMELRLRDLTVTPSGARALTEARLDGRVTIDGKDLEPLVAAVLGPEPAIAGGVTGDLSIGGTLGAPRASGGIELPRVGVTQTNPACPEPTRRTLFLDGVKADVTWADGQLVARPLSATVAGGTVTASVVATAEGGSAELKDVVVKAMRLEPLLVDFLCQGYAVTGPLELTGAFAFALRDPAGTLSGAGQLQVGSGKLVGAQALAVLGNIARIGGAVSGLLGADPDAVGTSPLEFEGIAGTFRVANGVLTTRDLVYTSRAAKVALAGQYALPSGRMSFDVTLDHGRGQLQAKVSGTAASPSVQVEPASVLRSVDPGTVERGLRELLRRFR